jgi:FAD/FMN-containing dehydrogenase
MMTNELSNARAISRLESRLQGELVWPGDADYESERTVWNVAVNRRPAVIVRAVDAEDVIAAVDFARGQGLSVAVRSGGHSNAGLGTCDGGVLIDLSRLKQIDIDPVSRRARIEPGLTWAEVASAAHAHGLALTSGNSGSVGVGGLLLGGGIGWMARKYGLAIDRLRAVELVTASGHFVRASATQHADLFWGLRGGGGNFGVATAFEVELHPGGTVLGGVLVFDAALIRSVLPSLVRLALAAPDELTTDTAIALAPPVPFIPAQWHRRPVMAIMLCYTGNLAEGENVIAPLRRLSEPIADTVAPLPYPALFQLTQQQSETRLRVNARSYYLRPPHWRGLDALTRLVPTHVSAESTVELKIAGGAVGRVPHSATAHVHRDTPVLVACLTGGPDAAGDGRRQELLQRFEAVMRPHVAGSYVNGMGYDEADRSLNAYPPAPYARLVALKRRYDPTNMFRHNQNITPD